MNYASKPSYKFPKGNNAYGDYLAGLTDEEYAAHLELRRKRKSMRAAMKKVAEQHQEIWISQLHNAAYRCLEKAIVNQDPVAFATVWDRLVGKPDIKVDVTSDDKPLPFNDDLLGD